MKTGEAFNPYGMFYGSLIPDCIMRLNITNTAKLCWGRLAQYEKNGKISPEQETLAAELGVSKRSVIRAIQELEENSLIKKIPPTHIHMNNQYVFLWHKCMTEKDKTVTP